MTGMSRQAVSSVAVILAGTAVWAVAGPPVGSGDVPALLARVGQRLEQSYARARHVVCRETVRLQPLGHDLLWDGSHVRQLVYELRVSWEAASGDGKPPDATVLRRLLPVDGRPPRAGDKPGCLDPKSVSPEPLAMLLPHQQHDFVFSLAGERRTRAGSIAMLDFKSVSTEPPDIQWKDECVSADVPGRTRGRVWVEADTADVVRLDTQLTGLFEIPVPKPQIRRGAVSPLIFERADTSIRYRPVAFQDPDEIVMLPESIVTIEVARNAGVPRLRTTQTFSDCQRFITDARIVKDSDTR